MKNKSTDSLFMRRVLVILFLAFVMVLTVNSSDQGEDSAHASETDYSPESNHDGSNGNDHGDDHGGHNDDHSGHGDNHGNSSHGDDHGNGNHHDGEHEHHGIHVASLHFDYVRQPLIVSWFMIAVILVKLGFHHANFLASWMPESCVLIILGTVVGGILHATHVDTSDFYYIHPTTFFLFLLPPCILDAAYGLHDPVFFQNLGTILLCAVIGTVVNCFIIGPVLYGLAIAGAMGSIQITMIQCFVFASLVVAVDPVAVLAIFQEIGVNSVLYFLVFGESLLNDAVTVVLYNTIVTLSEMEENISASDVGLGFAAFFTVSLGGLSIGIIFGIFTALITRITQHVRAVEPLAIFILAYASYLMAELFHFSGIISMIGCGLMQAQYAFHNISHNSTITVKYFSKMLSGACDSIIFLFLGVALVRDDHVWQTGFVLWSAFLCLAVRFLVTYSLSFIANHVNRTRQIDTREQFIMSYGGLRGAVAFCLVAMLNKDTISNKNLFQTTTLFVILFTVFIQGITIKPLVKLLHIRGDEKVVSLCQEINDHVIDHILVFMEEVIGHYGHNSFKDWLDRLDDNYLKKFLQRDPVTKDQVIMELYQEIALQQHFETLYGGDLSSSRLDLYQPSIHDIPKGVMDLPLNPAMMRQSIDSYARAVMAAKRLSQQSASRKRRMTDASMSVDEKSVYDTVRSLQAVDEPGSTGKLEIHRFLSDSHEDSRSQKSEKKKSMNNILAKFMGVQEDNVFVENPTTKDLKKWLIKSPQKDAFTRRTDRNLTKGDDNELMNLLHEKQRRHERYMRGQSGLMTPSRSLVGSMSGLTGEDGNLNVDDEKDEQGARKRHFTVDPSLAAGGASAAIAKDRLEERKRRMRHKTVDFEGPQGHVKYTPRYQPRRTAVPQTFRGTGETSSPGSGILLARDRLPSIEESVKIVDERPKRSMSLDAMEQSTPASKKDDEEVALIPEDGSKVRENVKRQDADEKMFVALQHLDSAEL